MNTFDISMVSNNSSPFEFLFARTTAKPIITSFLQGEKKIYREENVTQNNKVENRSN